MTIGARLAQEWARIRRIVPRVRLVWILLIALGAYGVAFLGSGLGVASLVVLPAVAVATEFVFVRIRFPEFRFPDAALVTGLFLALLLPPAVPLVAGGAVTILAIALRHVLRYRGRPWFNPAAAGVLLGTVLFGLLPAWWGAISEVLVIAFGLTILAWDRRAWRLGPVFVVAYAGLAIMERAIVAQSMGQALSPSVSLLAALDPSVLFFGLFLVPEPRTAPTQPVLQPIYALVVAGGSALLPLAVPSLATLLALLAGNVFTLATRRALADAPAPDDHRRTDRAARATPRASRVAARWTIPHRIGAGILVLMLVGSIAAVQGGGSNSHLLLGVPPSTGSGASLAGCRVDNASIPSSTLDSLHQTLGPSVVLSYDRNTGVIVFYDPVNQVTVTETDLYEDYGFAEFNGDDYTAQGCAA